MIRRNSHQLAKTLVLDALLAIGLTATAIAPAFAQASGNWTKTASVNTVRQDHSAMLLQNGQVLAAGGSQNGAITAELYNPSTGTWTLDGGNSTPATRAKQSRCSPPEWF